MVLTTFSIRIRKSTLNRAILITFLIIISFTGLRLYSQTIGKIYILLFVIKF